MICPHCNNYVESKMLEFTLEQLQEARVFFEGNGIEISYIGDNIYKLVYLRLKEQGYPRVEYKSGGSLVRMFMAESEKGEHEVQSKQTRSKTVEPPTRGYNDYQKERTRKERSDKGQSRGSRVGVGRKLSSESSRGLCPGTKKERKPRSDRGQKRGKRSR